PLRSTRVPYTTLFRSQYGLRDSMLNSYNSATQDYQYHNRENEIVKKKLKLTSDDLLFLHRKAMEMGFWNVDDDMTTSRTDSLEGRAVPRYILEYKYKEKGETVTMDADYPGNPKMMDAPITTIETVLERMNIANAR